MLYLFCHTAIVRTLLKSLMLPYTVIMAVCGTVMGLLSFHYPKVWKISLENTELIKYT